jgi:hypothetical protein
VAVGGTAVDVARVGASPEKIMSIATTAMPLAAKARSIGFSAKRPCTSAHRRAG